MLAKLLAATPRFVEARRKQSDKNGNGRKESGEIQAYPLKPPLLVCNGAHRVRSMYKSAFLVQLSAVIVIIVPADLHPNKAGKFSREMFCRETGTCANPRFTIGQKAAASARLLKRSLIGLSCCQSFLSIADVSISRRV